VLFIDGKLAGDGTLTALLATPPSGYSQSIFYQSAPAGARFPLVILQKQSGVPTEAFTDPQAFDTDIWMVKAIDHASSGRYSAWSSIPKPRSVSVVIATSRRRGRASSPPSRAGPAPSLSPAPTARIADARTRRSS
jgi:hypothetical protein